MTYEEIFDNGYKILKNELEGDKKSAGNIIAVYSDLLAQKILDPVLKDKCTNYRLALLLCAIEKVRDVLHKSLMEAVGGDECYRLSEIAEDGAEQSGFDVEVKQRVSGD